MANRFDWLCPAPRSDAVTGGDLYNQRVVAALREAGHEVQVHREPSSLATGGRAVLVDSLFYDLGAELRARLDAGAAGRAAELIWLVHWLPSSVRLGRAPSLAELSCAERCALQNGDRFVVPGAFIADALINLGVDPAKLICVEPGTDPPPAAEGTSPMARRVPHDRVNLLCVGNLLPGKAQLRLVQALDSLGRTRLNWTLRLVGSPLLNPAYAQRIDQAVASAARAARRGLGEVHLCGRLEGAQLEQAYAQSQILISSSVMESYGLAIAQARARGLALAVRHGGHAAHHLNAAPEAGFCFETDAEFAEGMRRWLDDPAALTAALRAAHVSRRHRSWSLAARELAEALRTQAV